jgi:hypothetical protein
MDKNKNNKFVLVYAFYSKLALLNSKEIVLSPTISHIGITVVFVSLTHQTICVPLTSFVAMSTSHWNYVGGSGMR